jgi:ATP-binding cassette subfamily B protein
VVVDERGVVEQGRHHELVAADGIYRDFHEAQFGAVIS